MDLLNLPAAGGARQVFKLSAILPTTTSSSIG
jgi:hypothetical protein